MINYDLGLIDKHMLLMLKSFLEGYKAGKGIIDNTDSKIKNLEKIIKDKELFYKLIDMVLIDDIDQIIQAYAWMPKEITTIPKEEYNLLLSCFLEKVKVSGQEGLVIDNKLHRFSNAEELRKYLYELIGFKYQSKAEAYIIPEDEIIDPMASPNFKGIDNIYSAFGDTYLIERAKTPKHLYEYKTK